VSSVERDAFNADSGHHVNDPVAADMANAGASFDDDDLEFYDARDSLSPKSRFEIKNAFRGICCKTKGKVRLAEQCTELINGLSRNESPVFTSKVFV
jgi:hypothetical protein